MDADTPDPAGEAAEIRQFQVTVDARDPAAQSRFWSEVLHYVIPGPPGVELAEGADPLEAWNDFLAGLGVPPQERNSRSAVEDPKGRGPRIFFQRVPAVRVVPGDASS